MKLAVVLGVVLVAISADIADAEPHSQRTASMIMSPDPWYRDPNENYQEGPAISSYSEDPIFRKFQLYAKQYSRFYSNLGEFQARFGIWKNNYLKVQQLNAQDSSAKFGINQLSDRTGKELALMHGFKDQSKHDSGAPVHGRPQQQRYPDPMPI